MHCVSIPSGVNPDLRPALDALAAILTDRHYSPWAATRIVAYAASEGTLAGCPLLDPEDEPAAEAAFVEAMPAVPWTSPEWDGPEPDEDLDGPIEPPDDWKGSSHAGWASLAPIAGGGFDDEPFIPTREDEACYSAWLADLEASRDAMDFPRIKDDADRRRDRLDVAEFYAAHPGA